GLCDPRETLHRLSARALGRRYGPRLRLGGRLCMGSVAAPPVSTRGGASHRGGVRRCALVEWLRQSFSLVRAEISGTDRRVVSQRNEVSAVARLSADDARADSCRARAS